MMMSTLHDNLAICQQLITSLESSGNTDANEMFNVHGRLKEITESLEGWVEKNPGSISEICEVSLEAREAFEVADTLAETYNGLMDVRCSMESVGVSSDLADIMAKAAIKAHLSRLPMEFETYSHESLGNIISTIWKALLSFTKKIIGIIRGFFEKVWSFITGRKKTLKENQTQARQFKQTDKDVDAFIDRQKKELKKDTSDKKNDEMERRKRATARTIWKRNRRKEKANALPPPTTTADNTPSTDPSLEIKQVIEEEIEINVDASRMVRKTILFLTGAMRSKVMGDAFLGIEHVSFLGDELLDVVEITTEATEALPDLVDKLLANKGNMWETYRKHPALFKLTIPGILNDKKALYVIRPNSQLTQLPDTEASKKFSIEEMVSVDDVYKGEFPAPRAVSELTNKAIKLTDAPRSMAKIDDYLKRFQKVFEKVSSTVSDDHTEQDLKELQVIITSHLQRVLLPSVAALNEAIAEYVNYTANLTSEAVALYKEDLG